MKSLALSVLYFLTAGTVYAQDVLSSFGAPTQNTLEGTSFRTLVYERLGGFVQSLYVVLLGIALVVLIWGVVKYFAPGGNEEEKRTQAKYLLTWGLVGIVFLMSITFIVRMVMDTFTFF